MKGKNIPVRLIAYLMGLFLISAGVAVSVKSDLGTSPVASIPYAMTCVWGIELGNATIMVQTFLVLVQIPILRKEFKWIYIFQIPVSVIFGKFNTLCVYIASFAPDPQNMVLRIFMIFVSSALIAAGIFFYMPANIMSMSTEGIMQAISHVTHIEFAKVKIGFDISWVLVALIICLVGIGTMGSVGIGTVIAAITVGIIVGFYNRHFGKWRDEKILKREPLY